MPIIGGQSTPSSKPPKKPKAPKPQAVYKLAAEQEAQQQRGGATNINALGGVSGPDVKHLVGPPPKKPKPKSQMEYKFGAEEEGQQQRGGATNINAYGGVSGPDLNPGPYYSSRQEKTPKQTGNAVTGTSPYRGGTAKKGGSFAGPRDGGVTKTDVAPSGGGKSSGSRFVPADTSSPARSDKTAPLSGAVPVGASGSPSGGGFVFGENPVSDSFVGSFQGGGQEGGATNPLTAGSFESLKNRDVEEAAVAYGAKKGKRAERRSRRGTE
jgi:hypothetical protein